ncbi:MAG: peptide-N-glycosidase F-related protein [Bacteroidales bacterium]|jgi:hypothetical protein|nr:peptide-N-glycosidase F-related protein [Bacteroidales bacterium]MDD4176634.1 peptide-N-glycosidase F-related protein [Bacteroidales bacterium]MDD4741893.1 peptide-N-glycosidase F-related protein [Bacteroidales bacterium]MDY0335108.1 peptide-N-glycosidase F-related protein [Bacteroidales bacterium]NCU35828.1 T9SS type A sorting domain-containing protein [Candidatus Falkowbacteria bacterium]
MKTHLLTVGFLLAALMGMSQIVSTYDFNSLNPGDLNNQDNWKTIAHSAASSPDFEVGYASGTVVSPDGSQFVFYQHGGPNIGRTATRKSTSNFEFDFSDGVVEVEVDMHRNWWGVFFGVGFDADNDGHIAPGLSTEPNDGGVYIHLREAAPAGNKLVLPSDTEISFTANTEGWTRFKMVMDFTANGGVGTIALFYKVNALGEWLPAAEIQGVSMQLTPGSGNKNDNTVWDGIFFHSQGGTGAFDNILVQQPDLNGLYQFINFPAIANKLTTDAPFQLLATASSGLPVVYTILEGPATVSGNILTLAGQPGIVKVKASQPGDDVYAPANDLINAFEVVDASAYFPTLKVRRPVDDNKVYMEELKPVMFVAESGVEHPEVLSVESLTFSLEGELLPVIIRENNHFTTYWTPPAFGNYSMTVTSTITGGNVTSKVVNFEVTSDITDMEVQTFAGELVTAAAQIVYGTYIFPTFTGAFSNINSVLTISCPAGGCDPYDRVSHVEIKDLDGNWIEMYRYLTPFGVGCSDEADVTDYASLLQGEVDVRYHCITWDKGLLIDIRYEFTKGTPEYLYSLVTPIWRGEFPFGDMSNLQPVPPAVVNFHPDAAAATLKIMTSGHNWGENNTGNASEFYHATHYVNVNGSRTFTQDLWSVCNPNPAGCQPQNGTWIYSRAGWCPGSIARIYDFDMTSFVGTSNLNLEYEFDPNYVDLCHPSNPDCVTGVTCPNCEDTFNPLMNVTTHVITFSNMISVSVPAMELSGLRVDPNPASDYFILESYQPARNQNSTVEFINLSGKVVSRFDWNGERTHVDVRAFPTGLYLLKVTSKAGVDIKKVVIR